MRAPFVTDINCRAVQAVFEARKAGVVYICSGGGDIDAARALVDVIQTYGLRTAAVGLVQSAAVPVFAAGRRRSATADTRFLWHPPYIESVKLGALELLSEALTVRDWARWANRLLESRTKESETFWTDMSGAHSSFGVDEAVRWGLVDTVRAHGAGEVVDPVLQAAEAAVDPVGGEEGRGDD